MADLVARIIVAATDKATNPLERVKMAANGLTVELSKNQKELRGLEKSMRTLQKYADNEKEIDQLNDKLHKNSENIADLTAKIAKAGVPTLEQAQKMAMLTQQHERLTTRIDRLRDKNTQLSDSMKKAGIDTQLLSKAEAVLISVQN